MFEKNLSISLLLDFYGDILSERQKEILDFYYNDDLSLAEIAENYDISRQGVRDLIKKAEEEIFFLEEKLGLAQKMSALKIHSDKALRIAENGGNIQEIQKEIEEIAKIIK